MFRLFYFSQTPKFADRFCFLVLTFSILFPPYPPPVETKQTPKHSLTELSSSQILFCLSLCTNTKNTLSPFLSGTYTQSTRVPPRFSSPRFSVESCSHSKSRPLVESTISKKKSRKKARAIVYKQTSLKSQLQRHLLVVGSIH